MTRVKQLEQRVRVLLFRDLEGLQVLWDDFFHSGPRQVSIEKVLHEVFRHTISDDLLLRSVNLFRHILRNITHQ